MSNQSKTPGADEQQRKQVDRTFERATQQQPQEYRNKSSEKKQVEIGADKTADPIKGLDAPDTPSGR